MIRRLMRKAPLLTSFLLLVLAGFAGWGLYELGYIVFTDPVDRLMDRYQPGAPGAVHRRLEVDLLAVGPRGVPALLRWMQDADKGKAKLAAGTLIGLGRRAHSALPVLCSWMAGNVPRTAKLDLRSKAFEAACAMVAPSDVPELIALAESSMGWDLGIRLLGEAGGPKAVAHLSGILMADIKPTKFSHIRPEAALDALENCTDPGASAVIAMATRDIIAARRGPLRLLDLGELVAVVIKKCQEGEELVKQGIVEGRLPYVRATFLSGLAFETWQVAGNDAARRWIRGMARQWLASDVRQLRVAALEAFGDYIVDDQDITPRLAAALTQHDDSPTQWAAVRALEQRSGRLVQDALISRLRSTEDGLMRKHLREVLRQMAEKRREAGDMADAERLLEAIKDEERTPEWEPAKVLDEAEGGFLVAEGLRAERLTRLLAVAPNVRDSGMWTPLHWAVKEGQLKAVRSLVSRGAELDALTRRGETALHMAARSEAAEAPAIAAFLLDRGCSPKVTDHMGRTPLHEAARCGNLPVIRLLIDRGDDVNALDYAGVTPTWTALDKGQTAAANLLQQHGGVR